MSYTTMIDVLRCKEGWEVKDTNGDGACHWSAVKILGTRLGKVIDKEGLLKPLVSSILRL